MTGGMGRMTGVGCGGGVAVDEGGVGCVCGSFALLASKLGQGFEEAVFYTAFVEHEAVEDFVAAEVSVDGGAEDEVGVVVGGGAVETGDVLHKIGVVEQHAVEELVLDSLGSFQAPGEGRDAVGKEGFYAVSRGEIVDHPLVVGVEFFLAFAFYDVGAGG